MITVVNQNSLDIDKISIKWKPILEKLNVHINHPNLLTALSLYCESHALIESSSMNYNMPGTSVTGNVFHNDIQPNYNNSVLPEALKVISKLNLKDKNVQVAGSPMFHYIDNDNLYKSASVKSIDVNTSLTRSENIDNIKEQLLIELADKINAQLQDYNTIVLYLLVTRISTMADGVKAPVISIVSRFLLMDPINSEEIVKPDQDLLHFENVSLSNATTEQLLAELAYRLNK